MSLIKQTATFPEAVSSAVFSAATPSLSDNEQLALQCDNEGNLLVNAAVGTIIANPETYTPKFYNGTGASVVQAKLAAGTVGGYFFDNTANSVPAFIQFFDTAAAVTLGTNVPTFVLVVPANLGANAAIPIKFLSGIQFAATTTFNGSTALGSAVNLTVFFA